MLTRLSHKITVVMEGQNILGCSFLQIFYHRFWDAANKFRVLWNSTVTQLPFFFIDLF